MSLEEKKQEVKEGPRKVKPCGVKEKPNEGSQLFIHQHHSPKDTGQ